MLAKLLIVAICVATGLAILVFADVTQAALIKNNKIDGPTSERIIKWTVSTLAILAIATIFALR